MACPGDDTLIALLEHALARDALDALELHVDSCPVCRLTVVAVCAELGLTERPGRAAAAPRPPGGR